MIVRVELSNEEFENLRLLQEYQRKAANRRYPEPMGELIRPFFDFDRMGKAMEEAKEQADASAAGAVIEKIRRPRGRRPKATQP